MCFCIFGVRYISAALACNRKKGTIRRPLRRAIRFACGGLDGLVQHTGLRDDLVAFGPVDIAGEGGDEEGGEYRENDEHDDQLNERKAAPVFEYFHENSFFLLSFSLMILL